MYKSTRGSLLRLATSVTSSMMTIVTSLFIFAAGSLIASFALALPALDVVPQARSLESVGWQPLAAWAFSVATSALPFIYSFTRKDFPVGGQHGDFDFSAALYHVFFWGLRLTDALLDAMAIGVISGATNEPSLAYLLHASMYEIMVVGVVFVLSNVTDDLKGVVVAATQRYADWVQSLIIAKGTLGWALSGNYSYNSRRQRHRPPVRPQPMPSHPLGDQPQAQFDAATRAAE